MAKRRPPGERLAIALLVVVAVIMLALLILGEQDRQPGVGGRAVPERTR